MSPRLQPEGSPAASVLIIGAGIIGLATAHHLALRRPDLRITIIDKESGPAQHQSGRNSGVIHSGIYYKKTSLKSRLCLRGKALLREFCERETISIDTCGKVIVAKSAAERARLQALLDANGSIVEARMLNAAELREVEPHCAGIAALHVPGAAIVDYGAVARRLVESLAAAGHTFAWNAEVTSITACASQSAATEQIIGCACGREFRADMIIGCAGLQADRLAGLGGLRPEVRIVPFRGEYFRLSPRAAQLCNGLMYPAPDPTLPFLGVHVHRVMSQDGRAAAECGPNAVLSFGRESYDSHALDFGGLRDAAATFSYAGALRLFKRHWRSGLAELQRSLSRRRFLASVQQLIPEIQMRDLEPRSPGIRAQAVAADGSLYDDFLIMQRAGQVHVVNAPSPAATAAFAIGEEVVARVLRQDV